MQSQWFEKLFNNELQPKLNAYNNSLPQMHIKALFGLLFYSYIIAQTSFDFEAKSCSSCPMLQFFQLCVCVLPNWSLHAHRRKLTLGVKVWDFFSSCLAVCKQKVFFYTVVLHSKEMCIHGHFKTPTVFKNCQKSLIFASEASNVNFQKNLG